MRSPPQTKTVHPLHRISTAILTLLILVAGGAYLAWEHTEHDGFLTVSIGTNPLMQTADLIPDDFAKPVKSKKKVVAAEPVATDFASPLPQHKPTPPVQVQP